VYEHPWFDWFSPVDDTGERLRRANARRGVVIVGMRGASPSAEAVGPYSIEHR